MNYTLLGLQKLFRFPKIVIKFLIWLIFAEISLLWQMICLPKNCLDWLGGDPELNGRSYLPKDQIWKSNFDLFLTKSIGKRFSFVSYSDDYLEEGRYRNVVAVFTGPLSIIIFSILS